MKTTGKDSFDKFEISNNKDVGVMKTVTEYDPDFKVYVQIPIFGNTNTKLENQIKIVEQQAIKNYNERNK